MDDCYACYEAEPKHPHFEGDIYVSPAVPHAVCLFVASSPCWRHSRSGITTSSTQHIRSCPQQTLCSTHTHTSTKLNCLQYYYSLYSGLYLFEYCWFHLNSGTVHHAPSMDDFLHRACPWVMGHRRFVEGYDRASNRMVCTSILCSRLLSSDDRYRKQIFPHLRRITTRPAVPDYKSSHSCR